MATSGLKYVRVLI